MSQKSIKTENTSTIELAESFLAYCKANPSQRFWQALLNWSEVPYIFISNKPIYKYHPPEGGVLIDPYHWKGKNARY